VSKTTFESWDEEEYFPGIPDILIAHGSFWKKVLIYGKHYFQINKY
jgi:hypothetical protein